MNFFLNMIVDTGLRSVAFFKKHRFVVLSCLSVVSSVAAIEFLSG